MRNAYCRPPHATPSLGRVVPQHRAVRPGLPRAAALTLSLLVLAVAALVSAWAWFGARGEVVAFPPTASATPTPTPDPGGDATPEVTPAGTATVHVTGAVTVPGVYVLTLGARVDDAIAAAGGLTADADESALNRAQVLTDAQQVYVPVEGEAPAPAAGAGAGAAPSGTINLNTASAAELEELPGVGPALAGEIVTWRQTRGPFSSVEDLDDVPGIGPAVLEKVRARVTV
ncbi:MAG: ComEA family DNA-binding protein [Actinobacteria bacterium]|nr:ComEA family DNA-binding protein [Actinomycetota bacterium]